MLWAGGGQDPGPLAGVRDRQVNGQAQQVMSLLFCFFKPHKGPWLLPCKMTEKISQFLQKDLFCLLGPCHNFRYCANSSLCVGGASRGDTDSQWKEKSSTGHNNPLKGFDESTGQGPVSWLSAARRPV